MFYMSYIIILQAVAAWLDTAALINNPQPSLSKVVFNHRLFGEHLMKKDCHIRESVALKLLRITPSAATPLMTSATRSCTGPAAATVDARAGAHLASVARNEAAPRRRALSSYRLSAERQQSAGGKQVAARLRCAL